MLLADALNLLKDRAGAELAVRRAIELTPASPQYYSRLIQLQIVDGRKEDALATARDYATNHPGLDADLLLANTLTQIDRASDAIALLAKAYTVKPAAGLASALAGTWMTIGDTKKAISALSDWLQKNPKDFGIRLEYASLLLQAGDQNAARREFESLLKDRPEDPVSLDDLGWIIQKDDPRRALSLVTMAAKIAPQSPNIIDTLGWLKLQQRDAQGALALLRRAHDMNSEDPEIGYHLALALDASGKRPEAKSLLKSVLARNPKFDDASDAQQLIARW